MTWVLVRLGCGAAILACLILSACQPQKPPAPKAIGEAYVVPDILPLRREIPPASGVAGTAKRGERVEITARRRKFVKVRTPSGAEGWTEDGQLLTPELHQQLQQTSAQSANLPSLGVYRARDVLNVHIDPYRWSPTFYRLKEEEKVELLGRRVAERTAGAPGSTPAPAGKPAAYDEWNLVRTAEKHVGWVLARMIDADIPDEVAQYAEGRRITSYFPLAEVVDGDQLKKVWLWTTTERSLEVHDFDSIRVFNWGRRRHRYETAHIERGLKGYFPVLVTSRVETRFGAGPGFSFLVEKRDGQRYTRRYVMIGHLVRMYSEEPVAAVVSPPQPEGGAEPAPAAPAPSWWRRVWNWIRGI
jgi:hypothetical protein